jgi:hypothetical protein
VAPPPAMWRMGSERRLKMWGMEMNWKCEPLTPCVGSRFRPAIATALPRMCEACAYTVPTVQPAQARSRRSARPANQGDPKCSGGSPNLQQESCGLLGATGGRAASRAEGRGQSNCPDGVCACHCVGRLPCADRDNAIGCTAGGKTANYDVRYPGTYSSTRDNLDGFWRNVIGRHTALCSAVCLRTSRRTCMSIASANW